MSEITEWILGPFVAGYIAGLISGIFIFIKIHHRIRGMPHASSTRAQDTASPLTAGVPQPQPADEWR
jgi:hypothetical protein